MLCFISQTLLGSAAVVRLNVCVYKPTHLDLPLHAIYAATVSKKKEKFHFGRKYDTNTLYSRAIFVVKR